MELLILVIAEKPDLGKAIAAATPGGGTYIGKEQISRHLSTEKKWSFAGAPAIFSR